MNQKKLWIKCPIPIDQIQHKLVRASFSLNGGATIQTGIAKILVVENNQGMSSVKLQFQSMPDQKSISYSSFYLDEEGVKQMEKIKEDDYQYVIKDLIHLQK